MNWASCPETGPSLFGSQVAGSRSSVTKDGRARSPHSRTVWGATSARTSGPVRLAVNSRGAAAFPGRALRSVCA